MSSKNYQVVFQFKAALDSSISKSFSGVTKEIDKLTEKQMALQAALAEAKNMQAYKQHLEELQSELAGLTQAEQTATQALEKAVFARREAQQEEKTHADRIAELKLALKSENDEHREIIAKLKDEKASKEEINAENLRHAQAVKKINDELAAEQRALKKSTDARKEAERVEKEAEAAKRSASNAVAEQNRKIAEEEAALRRCSDALKAAGYDTKNLDDAINGMSRRLAEVNERLAEATKRQQEIDAAMATWERRANNLRAMAMGLDLMATGAEKVWQLVSNSMDSASALEKQVSAIKAISGATQEETTAITKMIRETGATTVFTAEEVAEAVQKMALAGWESQQMIAGIPSVVNLAAAAGEDLESMTSIVADGMNAFQLSGEKAALKFSDVLARAATSSNTNVGLMGESLSYVETTAGNLGYSIEDVSIALAMMANNALKGSVAGSALNTMLTRMSGANATAAKQMEEMGLSMYDEFEHAKPLKQFLDELRGAFKNFGDDAQAAQVAAYKLAGQRGMRGLLALVNLNDEAYEKLTRDIYDFNGAANQIGTERLENYSGKMQLLSDAWTDFKITLGNKVLPTATATVEMLTQMVNKAKDLAETAPTLTLWAANTSLAIMGLSKVISGASTAAQSLYYIIKTLGMAGIGSGAVFAGLGYAGLAAVGLGAVAAVYQSWYSSDEYKELMTGYGIQSAIEEHRTRDEEILLTPYQAIQETAGMSYAEKIALYDDQINEYGKSIKTAERDLEDAKSAREAFIKKMQDEGKYKYENVYMGDDLNGPVYQQVLDITGMDADEVRNMHMLDDAVDDAQFRLDNMLALRGGFQQLRAQMIADFREETKLQEVTAEQYEALEKKAQDVASAWAEVWQRTYEAYSGVFGLFEEVERKKASMTDMEKGLESQAKYWEDYAKNLEIVKTVSNDAGIELGNLWDLIGNSGDTQSAAYLQAIVDSLGNLENPDTTELEHLIGLFNDAEEAKRAAVEAFDEGSKEVREKLQEYSDELQGIIESTNSYTEAKNAMEETMDGFLVGLDNKDDAVIAAAMRFAGRLRATMAGAGDGQENDGGSGPHAASGTGNAMPGAYLVGERGPEMVLMGGGERVLSAGQTKRLLSMASGAGAGSFVVNVNVAGSASAQTVADLRAYGNELEAMFKRLLRNERVNAQRRAYT